MEIAIVVVAYNRTDSVRSLLDSLLKAHYPQPVPLIISIDKSDTDAVERIADEFEWPFGVKIVVKHRENLGLRKHILSIGEFTKQYDGVIVLEDDLEVSPSFYNFALEAVDKYHDDDRIAGVSLYRFPVNLQTGLPFLPEENGYDAFFFQNAQSWGQVWMKNAWARFAEWYAANSDEFSDLPHLPRTICHWGKNSWLKYHIKYCIEEDKFFVYPYTSLTFCSGAAGAHSDSENNYPHCSILQGNLVGFRLPDFDNGVKYDAYYERVGFERYTGVEDVCFDLYGHKGNRMNRRFWLTTRLRPYKVVRSYGMKYLPMEQNVARGVEGQAIFLYDTSIRAAKPKSNFLDVLLYFKYNSLFSYMMTIGPFKSALRLFGYVMHKLSKRII